MPQKILNNERMLIMKKFKRILALALAAIMALGMYSTSVFATGAEDPCTEIEVTKTVTVDKNGTLLPEETFHITMLPATEEGTDANGQKVEVGPSLVNDTIEFTFDSTDSTSTGSVEKSDAFELTFVTPDDATSAFDHTGVYRYYVTEQEAFDENGDEVSNGYIDYDTTKYIVDLYIDQNSKGEYVVSNYVITIDGQSTKPPKIAFENEISCSNLMIYKQVKGTEYQQGEFYTFRILIPVGGTTIDLTEGQKLQAQIYDANGLVIDTENGRTDANGLVELTVAGDDIGADMAKYATEFKLKKGEYLEILGVPVTMVYKVQEVTDTDDFAKEGYTVTYNYKEYGTNETDTKGELKGQEGDTVIGTINTESNEVTFINTRNIEVPNSGVSIDFLPYALALIVAVCGGVLFIIMKKRSVN
jgi:hypothetical protein